MAVVVLAPFGRVDEGRVGGLELAKIDSVLDPVLADAIRLKGKDANQLELGGCSGISCILVGMSDSGEPSVARLDGIVVCGLGDLEDGVVVVVDLDWSHRNSDIESGRRELTITLK